MALKPIVSYKNQSVDGPASRAAATTITHEILLGVDNYGGPTANNNAVPTGAKVFGGTILLAFTNLVTVSSLLHLNIAMLRSGQAAPSPGAVGGNPNRNCIIYTMMKFLGKDQNSNFLITFKTPRTYQRIREGDRWLILYENDTVFASATQAIIKFYR